MVVGEMVGEMVVGEVVVGTSAFIVWVKGQQAVQPVLLFTPATNQGDNPLWANCTINIDSLIIHWEWIRRCRRIKKKQRQHCR